MQRCQGGNIPLRKALSCYYICDTLLLLPVTSISPPSSTCEKGRMECAFSACPQDGGFTLWSPWSPCSVSCGGLGNMTRSRNCSNPPPANGGRECEGPSVDIKYCQAPDCEGETLVIPYCRTLFSSVECSIYSTDL